MTWLRRWAPAAYRALLRAYPREFRDRFAAEMERTFERALATTETVGDGIRLIGRALLDFGSTVGVEHWDEWNQGRGDGVMTGWTDDVRRVSRGLARAPGLVVAIVLTLGLGIGATAGLFAVVDGVLLTPLPYPDADRIVSVSEQVEERPTQTLSISYPNGADWRDRNSTLERLALFRGGTLTLTGRERAENLAVLFVDPEYYSILGLEPELGRFTSAGENAVPAGHPLAVLSYASWQNHFGGAVGVLGRSIELSGLPYTIVGVMPERHREPFPSQSGGTTDLWVPSMMAPQMDPRGNAVVENRRVRTFGALGLLAEGQTAESAEADLDRIADRLEEAFPGENRGLGVAVTRLDEVLTTDIRGTVLLLLGGAVVLLAIACFNVVNLLLVRGSTRRTEVAVQIALGASRRRIARQLLIESVLLSALGGLAGIGTAALGLPLLLGLVPNQLPVVAEVRLDGSVLLAMMALTTAIGCVVGLVPARRATDVDLSRSMATRGGVGDRVAERLRSGLVVLELGTATVLLVGTMLLVRGFSEVTSSDPGFETARIITARVTLAPADYPDLESLAEGIEQLTARVAAMPGVEWATPWGPGRPGQSGFLQSSIPDGMEVPGIAESPLGRRQHVGPGTLERMGIPILHGRGISADDRMDAERVAVVGESMANELWPGESPLGRVFRGFTPVGQPHDPSRTWIVVGVAADAQHGGRLPVTGGGQTSNDAYFPMAQRPERNFVLVVRTRDEPDIAPIREAIAGFDPDIPVFAVATMEELFGFEEAPARFAAVLMTFFGLAALTLAGLGIYGVISFTVVQQRREIGLRSALGASRGRVLRGYLLKGLRMSATGFVVGGAASTLVIGALESLGTVPIALDVLVVGAAGGVLTVMAVIACILPAIGATRIAPLVALSE